MNELQRFKAVVHFDKPDYVPTFAFPWAAGISWGCMEPTRLRLVEEGMPEWVGNSNYEMGRDDYWENYLSKGSQVSWMKYWGTCGPIDLGFYPAEPCKGFKTETRIEDGFEIVSSESGCLTRQVLNNDITYSMPEYIEFDVRDRESWEFYKERMTPGSMWSAEKIEEHCKKFDDRDKPLNIPVAATFSTLRGLMGPEKALLLFYEDPDLLKDIMHWTQTISREHIFPIIRRLKPEIISTGEDLCFKTGMLFGPHHFKEFFESWYREVGELAKECSADLVAIDTDGLAMDFVPLVRECGVNGMYPFEVKPGNDLFKLREMYPDFILFGWLEKEYLNKGNENKVKDDILLKVPTLLEKGGYFPNLDHGVQPPAVFESMCRFMTLLHELTGNPEGEFPRMY